MMHWNLDEWGLVQAIHNLISFPHPLTSRAWVQKLIRYICRSRLLSGPVQANFQSSILIAIGINVQYSMSKQVNKETNLFEYTEESIKSLDWKEHIRLRPGMYIGKLGDGIVLTMVSMCW